MTCPSSWRRREHGGGQVHEVHVVEVGVEGVDVDGHVRGCGCCARMKRTLQLSSVTSLQRPGIAVRPVRGQMSVTRELFKSAIPVELREEHDLSGKVEVDN